MSPFPSRRRPLTLAVTGLAAAAALFGVAACSSNSSTPAGGTPSAAPSAPAAGHHHKAKGVAGKITAENGTSWTVVNAKGKQYTVTITPQTKFGTEAEPATQQQFAVGDEVRARGKMADGTVTATRITHAKAAAASTAPSPAPAG